MTKKSLIAAVLACTWLVFGASASALAGSSGNAPYLSQLRHLDAQAFAQENRLNRAIAELDAAALVQKGSDLLPAPKIDWQAEKKDARAQLVKLDGQRRDLVAKAIQAAGTERSAAFTEASLAQYLLSLRQAWRGRYPLRPTRVADVGKEECPDPIGDQLLFDLAQAVVQSRPQDYVAALARMQQALNCFTVEDARRLADALVYPFYETSPDVDTGIEVVSDAKPASKSAGSSENIPQFPAELAHQARYAALTAFTNLYVLIQDAGKTFGPTELHRFMVTNRRSMGQVFFNPASPVRSAGYWLYSPTLDRLVRVKYLCEGETKADLERKQKEGRDADECVSGTASLDALLDGNRLGTLSCTLTEMLTPRLDLTRGYECNRNVCSEAVLDMPGIELMRQNGQTPYNTPLAQLEKDRCGGNGGGGGSAGVLDAALDLMGCVTERLSSVGSRGQTQCVADVARPGWFPDLSYAPETHPTCGDLLAEPRVAPNGAVSGKDTLAPWCKNNPKSANCRVMDVGYVEQLAKFGVGDPTELPEEFVEEFYDGFAGWAGFVEGDDSGECKTVCFDTNKVVINPDWAEKLTPDEKEELDRYVQTVADFLREKQEYCENEGSSDPDCASFNQAVEDDMGEQDPDSYCAPDVGDCGSCNPDQARVDALMDCINLDDPQINEDPGFIDPLPWEGTYVQSQGLAIWEACMAQTQETENSMACATYKCPQEQQPEADGNGGCRCTSPSNGGPIRQACGALDCLQGSSPVMGPAGCMCNTPGRAPLTPPEGPFPEPGV